MPATCIYNYNFKAFFLEHIDAVLCYDNWINFRITTNYFQL